MCWISQACLKEYLGAFPLCPTDWLWVFGCWLLEAQKFPLACFSFPQSLSLLAKSLSYDYRPGWESLSAIITDAFIPLPQVLVGVCVCVHVRACALSDAFSLFACVHMVDVCVWKERRCKIDEGGINVCVCTCGRLQGGVLCADVDKALCFSVHLPVICVYSPRLTQSSHTRLI